VKLTCATSSGSGAHHLGVSVFPHGRCAGTSRSRRDPRSSVAGSKGAPPSRAARDDKGPGRVWHGSRARVKAHEAKMRGKIPRAGADSYACETSYSWFSHEPCVAPGEHV